MKPSSSDDAPPPMNTPPLPVLTGVPIASTTPDSTERLRLYTVLFEVLTLVLAEILGTLFVGLAGEKFLGSNLFNVICSAGIVSVMAYFVVAALGRQPRSFRIRRVMLEMIVVVVIFSTLGLTLQLPLNQIGVGFVVNVIAGPIGLLLSLALVPPHEKAI